MTNELLAENSVLKQQRDRMIGEYLGKVELCDECIAQSFCIKHSLRSARVPQDYCQNNMVEYLKSIPYRS